MPSAKVISFINMKGGVGKTTLAVNCGYTLTQDFGKKVLIIDVDPQMNASQYTLKESQVREIYNHPEKTIHGIIAQDSHLPEVLEEEPDEEEMQFEGIFQIKNNFDIIPSHLMIMDQNLDSSPYKLTRFIEDNLLSRYDTIILDLPPTISSYTKIGLLASGYYIVPMATDHLSFLGLPLLQKYILKISREFDKQLEFSGIIFNKVHPNYRIYHEIKEKVMQNPEWSAKLFTNELKDTTAIAQAFSQENIETNRQFISELNDQEIRTQIMNITMELMRRVRL